MRLRRGPTNVPRPRAITGRVAKEIHPVDIPATRRRLLGQARRVRELGRGGEGDYENSSQIWCHCLTFDVVWSSDLDVKVAAGVADFWSAMQKSAPCSLHMQP